MRKKFLCGIIAGLILCGTGFVSFDCLLWRLFGFDYCRTPELLYVSALEVEDNNCYICVEDMVTGSFSTTRYNGLIFEFSNGILKIGVHKGTIGAKEKFSEKIIVDGSITEVRLCGNSSEQVLFKQ